MIRLDTVTETQGGCVSPLPLTKPAGLAHTPSQYIYRLVCMHLAGDKRIISEYMACYGEYRDDLSDIAFIEYFGEQDFFDGEAACFPDWIDLTSIE